MPAYRTFEQHLDPAFGPKRILALDGGGLCGVLMVGMLRELVRPALADLSATSQVAEC